MPAWRGARCTLLGAVYLPLSGVIDPRAESAPVGAHCSLVCSDGGVRPWLLLAAPTRGKQALKYPRIIDVKFK